MNVVISAGGRFHAHHLAHELHHHNSLQKLFTFDYTAADNGRVPPTHVHCVTSCKIMNDLFVRFRGARFFNKASFNIIKDNLFDRMVSNQLQRLEACDIFVGWAHYAHQSMQVAKQRGALVIIESGSCHILAQQEILHNEYARLGVPFHSIHPATIDKMLSEYADADYIMTLSHFAQQSFIAQGVPTHKVLRVPCGIDIDYFRSMQSVHKKKFRVIFTGLVSLRKGVHHLIDAWHQARLPLEQTELLIVGAMQKDFATIMPTLTIPNNVRFVGPIARPALRELYHQSSLFVLPSLEDGFGMVIGEAMASGLPVICTTSSAGPELIKEGISGLLVPPGDSASIAQRLEWCFTHQNELTFMGLQGQQDIAAFSWQRYGDAIYAMYQGLLGKAGTTNALTKALHGN